MKQFTIKSIFISIFLVVLLSNCQTEIDLIKNLPILSTDEATSVGIHTAISGGEITSDNGADVTARGVCWSTIPNPTIKDSITVDAAGTGKFSSNLKNLISDTTYYLRAYATNKNGTGYGLQVEFRTSKPYLATCYTNAISDIYDVSAVSGGKVYSSDGLEPITSRGVCWATKTNPTINDNKTIDGSGIGEFTSNLTGLTSRITYYVRAYAINKAGTKYGNEYSFTTLGIPVVETSYSPNNYIMPNIKDNGGCSIIDAGVCWNTSGNPTINNNVSSGLERNSDSLFPSDKFNSKTTYYFRAYATNKVGTGYGEQIIVTTP